MPPWPLCPGLLCALTRSQAGRRSGPSAKSQSHVALPSLAGGRSAPQTHPTPTCLWTGKSRVNGPEGSPGADGLAAHPRSATDWPWGPSSSPCLPGPINRLHQSNGSRMSEDVWRAQNRAWSVASTNVACGPPRKCM